MGNMRLRLRAQKERLFTDKVQVGSLPYGQGDWGATPGDDSYTYDVNNPVRCKVLDNESMEVNTGSEVEIAEAKIEIPSSNTNIIMESRLKLIERYRKELETPVYYRVIGLREVGSNKIVLASKVEGNASR